MDTVPTGPITLSPPPWKTKATIIIIPFRTDRATTKNFPEKAYHPLELQSGFASKESGSPKGGLSMIQLIRYHETPVGPYEEMIFTPGLFEYQVEGKKGRPAKKSHYRVTCMYVTQKYACRNGRKIWNLPTHLARIDWSESTSNPPTAHIIVFPHDHHPTSTPARSPYDDDPEYDPAEPFPSVHPFFRTIIKPIRWLPPFRLSTAFLSKLSLLNTTFVQPPLPQGKGSHGELVGTEQEGKWVKLGNYWERSKRARLVIVDMRQEEMLEGERCWFENWWPGLGRWRLGIRLDDGEVWLGEGERFEVRKQCDGRGARNDQGLGDRYD